MNLYLLTQRVNNNYDTYDSLLVAAPDPETAKKIYPSTGTYWDEDREAWGSMVLSEFRYVGNYGTWAYRPDQVEAELIGIAVEGTEQGIILGSFNAG